MFKKLQDKTTLTLLFIVFIGGILRFYKLDWGEGLFFHPDEYHIVAAVERLNFPTHLNPEFFSYGSLTVYLIYLTKIFFNIHTTSFLVGRYLSATFSTLSLILIYKVSKKLFKDINLSQVVTFVAAITPGIIQQAHFTTPETFLTFWLLSCLFFMLLWIQEKKVKHVFLSSLMLGLAIGTKILAFVFLPILIFSIFLNIEKINLKRLVKTFFLSFVSLVIVAATAVAVFPYSVLDYANFKNSMHYEIGVGKGEPLVFYTRQFINTSPFSFHYTKILPYALGWVVMTIGTFGFITLVKDIITKKFDDETKKKIIVTLAFLALFVPNAILFAKWTRFIAPTFPFWIILSVYFLHWIEKRGKRTYYTLLSLLLLSSSLYTFAFMKIYTGHDVRFTANKWIQENVPPNSTVLTESGNMIEVPFTGNYKKIPFDFYNLEGDALNKKLILSYLSSSDYFIVQSRRIYTNHQRLERMYPFTAKFYDLLFDGKLGYEKVAEFSAFPRIEIGNWKFEINDEKAEETWSVFDHPVIRIYKNPKINTQKDYERLFSRY